MAFNSSIGANITSFPEAAGFANHVSDGWMATGYLVIFFLVFAMTTWKQDTKASLLVNFLLVSIQATLLFFAQQISITVVYFWVGLFGLMVLLYYFGE